jgi:hypothetical protein
MAVIATVGGVGDGSGPRYGRAQRAYRTRNAYPNLPILNVHGHVTLAYRYQLISVFDFRPKKYTMKFFTRTQPGDPRARLVPLHTPPEDASDHREQ